MIVSTFTMLCRDCLVSFCYYQLIDILPVYSEIDRAIITGGKVEIFQDNWRKEAAEGYKEDEIVSFL